MDRVVEAAASDWKPLELRPWQVSAFDHIPVMLAEVLAALKPAAGGRYADGTLGGGGHASAILQASGPDGWLYGCDRDGESIEAVTHRLSAFAGRFEVRRGNHSELSDWVPAGVCDGVLFDLGVSSPQLDRAERGFSFMREGPLDMRMDARQPLTAADLVNGADEVELARWFWDLGEERDSRRFARGICAERRLGRIETTLQLAGLIERLAGGRHGRVHPATKVFQSLRMVVNDELGHLERALDGALKVLKPGGVLVVITFHSGEDRLVKAFGRRHSQDYEVEGAVDLPEFRRPRTPLLRWRPRKAIQPGEEEVRRNPRARSAQLRILVKV